MARHIAHYTLVRLLPQSDSGEFANMGVVVACPALGFFDFRLITRYRRITQFFEEFNRGLFTQVRREVEAELAHLRDHLHQRQFASGCREEALALRLVQDLVQPRETMIRYAPLRVAMTEDPRQLLDQVFARYVQRSSEETKSRREDTMLRLVREALQQDRRLNALFRADEVGTPDYQVPFPLVHRQDGQTLAAIKPLDLTQPDPKQIYEHGGRWADRLRRLKRLGAMPDHGVLVTTEAPPPEDERRHLAYRDIVGELRELSVQVSGVEQAGQILAFARDRIH